MVILPTPDSSIDLRAVTVRPTLGAREHRLWDRLVEEHHYLRFHGIVGKGLRHVALHGETWLALVGWQPGAFKLAARDRWIGWSPEQQFRRLHLICNNSRFVILTPGRVPNLASRVLGLSLRRLSADIQAVHGYPAFLAETFVDVSRFSGACYRASNWRSPGLTRGFARESGGAARWRHHGQPKEIFMYELTDAAAEALSRDEIPEGWNAEQHDDDEPMAAPRLRSLFACLGEVPECRKPRGKRYPLRTVLTIAVARRLLGRRADYVVTAVKENQETILDDLKAIDFGDAPAHETVEKGHGRFERRRCAVVDLSGAEWDGYAALHGRRQAMRIEREREILKTGGRSVELTWCLTSLGPERAGPEALLELVRNHWVIENRVHYVRDFTCDEDRCRAHVRHLPRNLSCLTNAAIAIVRCDGRFSYMPEANRHYAARAQEALDAILVPPGA